MRFYGASRRQFRSMGNRMVIHGRCVRKKTLSKITLTPPVRLEIKGKGRYDPDEKFGLDMEPEEVLAAIFEDAGVEEESVELELEENEPRLRLGRCKSHLRQTHLCFIAIPRQAL